MDGFKEGYRYFENNAGDVLASFEAADFAEEREAYVNSIKARAERIPWKNIWRIAIIIRKMF